MKITIAPSKDQTMEEHPFVTVEVSSPDDQMTLTQVAENLLAPALIAWGFGYHSVCELLQIEP